MQMSKSLPMSRVSSVAIIGGGAAGLIAFRVLRRLGFSVTLFEASQRLGGTWVYSPTPSNHSSVYESLRCNIPTHIMALCDVPFPSNTASFPDHRAVLRYWDQFVEKYVNMEHVRLGEKVESVRKDSQKWEVETEGFKGEYDAVVIATGRYRVGDDWKPKGWQEFVQSGGRMRHAREYRTSDGFEGKRVLVIGAGPSGSDIGIELSKVAKTVWVSHDNWRNRWLKGVNEVGRVTKVAGDGKVWTEEGETLVVDEILLCTGYVISWPFLKRGTGGVYNHGKWVEGLDGHLFAKDDATLVFLGLVWKVIPWPLIEDQISVAGRLWRDEISKARWEAWKKREAEDLEVAMQGENRYLLRLGGKQWEYRRRLAGLSGDKMVEQWVVEMATDCSIARRRDVHRYRSREYVVRNGEWRVYLDGVDVTGAQFAEDTSRPLIGADKK